MHRCPCGSKRAPESAFEREIQIGVVEDDLRVLATHLEREPLVEAPAGLADEATSLGGSGERDERYSGMLDHCRADLLTAAVHELYDFRRKTGLEKNLDKKRSGMRNVPRRLEDHCISAYESRKHFPGRNGHRKVERTNETRDSDRTAVAHRPLVAQLAGHGLAEQAPPLA